MSDSNLTNRPRGPEQPEPAAAGGRSVVSGTVSHASGAPFARAPLQVVDQRLRGQVIIGKGVTDEHGAFGIAYDSAKATGAGKERPDVAVQVLNRAGVVLAASDVRYDAPPAFAVDIIVPAQAGAEPSEFERVESAVERALQGLPAGEVASADLAYLAGRTGEPPETLSAYTTAAKLADASGAERSTFYALVRSQLPDTLATLLAPAGERQAAALKAAVAANVVPPRAAESQDALRRAAIDRVVASADDPEAPLFARVLGQVVPAADERARFVDHALKFEGPPERFWDDARGAGIGGEQIDAISFALQASLLADGHEPLVQRLVAERAQGGARSLRDLASLETDEWLRRIGDAGEGGVGDAGRTPQQLAASMQRMLEDAFPAVALAVRARKRPDSPLHDEAALTFLEANPEFDLLAPKLAARMRADGVVRPPGVDLDAAAARLTDVQRLYKLEPRFQTADTLMRAGLTSASAIARVGKEAFAGRFKDTLGHDAASALFDTADQRSAFALALYTRFGTSFNRVRPKATGSPEPDEGGVPDWETLFGPLDFCACEHCRSIYSPAAYLVDCLAFLRKCTNPAGRTALDELLRRRPDIAHLKLSCENATTPIPYIDLVVEVLEQAVLSKDATPRAMPDQTVGTEAELGAYPQSLDVRAYADHLGTAVHPWNLPFDLPAAEARAYLADLDVPRHRIMEAAHPARAGALLDEAVAGDLLGLSQAERLIVTGQPLTPARGPEEFWGFAAGDPNWLTTLAAVPELEQRSGLSFAALREVLRTRFVDPAGTVDVGLREDCNIEAMKVDGLDAGVADRLHRFVRLQRRLGWSTMDLDRVLWVLSTTTPRALDAGVLVRISLVARMVERSRLSPSDVAQLWAAPLDTHAYELDGGTLLASPYDARFLRASVTADPASAALALNATRDELADTTKMLDAALAPVLGALRVDAQSLDLVADTLTPGATAATTPLDLATLTRLARVPALARALRLTLRDLLGLMALTGLTPFDVGAHPEHLVLLAEEADRVKRSGFGIADLEFVLMHAERPATSGAADKAIAPVFEELRRGMLKIAAEHVVAPDAAGELTARKLAIVLGPAAATAVGYLNATATVTAPLAALPAGVQFAPPLDAKVRYDAAAQELQFLGAPTDAERDALLAVSADAAYTTAVHALYDQPRAFFTTQLAAPNAFTTAAEVAAELLDTAAKSVAEKFAWMLERLVPFVRDLLGRGLVKERMAAMLRLPAPVTDELLQRWITVGAGSAMTSLLGLAALPDAPSRANAADQFDAAVRLLATARTVLQFKLTPEEIAFAFDHGVARGWPDFDALPVARETAGAPARYAAWVRTASYVELRRAYPLDEPSLLDTFAAAASATPPTLDAHLAAIATITGWPLSDLRHVAGLPALGLTFPADFADEAPLTLVRPIMELVAATGTSAERLLGWAADAVTPGQAVEIAHAVRAAHDPEAWLELAKKIRDPLREQQRDALVAYLIARPDLTGDARITEPDDLYRHYLVDVEMCACMPSSRIVQGVGTAQLLVQRALMNLERDPADPSHDVVINADMARQWSWMKQYRIWEANRRVFVTPENWIEPELRQDKSPFFKTLESALMQSDVTADSAEDALRVYLEQLDTVARLEPSGAYHQTEATTAGQPSIDVLHVVARTTATPHRHFYRQLVDGGTWTAWEPLDIEIDADHVIPVVYNRRLFVYWPMILEGANDDSTPGKNGSPSAPERWIDVKLAWTERRKGKWTPKRVSDAALRVDIRKDWSGTLAFRASVDGSSGDLLIGAAMAWVTSQIAVDGAFRISAADGRITVDAQGLDAPAAVPPGTIASYQGYLEQQTIDIGFGTGGDELELPYRPGWFGATKTAVVLAETPHGKYRLLAPHQYQTFVSQDGFFFQHGGRVFFVRPSTHVRPRVLWPLAPPAVIGNWHDLYFEALRPDPRWRIPPDPGDPWIDPLEHVALPSFPAHSRDELLSPGVSHSGVLPSTTVLLDAHGPQAKQLAAVAINQAPLGGPLAARMGQMRAMSGKLQIADDVTLSPIKASVIDIDHVGASLAGSKYAGVISGSLFVGTETHYAFSAFYHPHVRSFMRELARSGIPGLLQRRLQIHPEEFLLGSHETFDFGTLYKPDLRYVEAPLPAEDVDFKPTGAYALYNWELFFHVPLLIATRLSKNQRFDEAQQWFHYIFDPTDASADSTPRRFWRTRPFYENESVTPIQELLKLLDYDGTDPASRKLRTDLEAQVAQWREHPFDPHLLAGLRPSAYQQCVVMKYLDNLIAWGDQRFRQDTMESVAEATQIYVLAAEILGKRPESAPKNGSVELKSWADIADDLDAFSNSVVALENELPPADGGMAKQAARDDAPPPAAAMGPTLYFCIPPNDKLLGYWDTVADRLFKIRHCMNIEGVVRQLSLFAPPIDPGMLVRAAAAGLSIDAALNAASSATLPHYRFAVLADRAKELCNEVRALGSQLLSALEKRDAEALAALRAGAEIDMLKTTRELRRLQIAEAENAIDALQRSRDMAAARQSYYAGRPYMNPHEQQQLSSLQSAHTFQSIAQAMDVLASGLALIPNLDIGVSGAFSSPVTKLRIGGIDLSGAVGFAKQALASLASQDTFTANMASVLGGYDRRRDDWLQQADQAAKEIKLIEAQIVGAELRRDMAEHELGALEQQLDQATTTRDFLHDKFTNAELYEWMSTQTSQLFFQGYQLAYDTAKLAERALRHELGDRGAVFVEFGYWDSLRKGLLSGERLAYDLQRMERAYLDANKREYELTKHVSLAQLDPAALVRLRTTGECFVELPETLFDGDYPGHYMRRLKSVAVTIPCVTGPYTNVNCTMTLLRNSARVSSTPADPYPRTGGEDNRFVDGMAAIQSVVTSTGQNDAGLFEPNLRDERFLPFEGAGAISRWNVRLPKADNRFDFDTISDVVLHVRYTARPGGAALETEARKALAESGVASGGARLLSAETDFGDAWFAFRQPLAPGAAARTLTLSLGAERFPFEARRGEIKIPRIDVLLALRDGTTLPAPLNLTITPPGEGATAHVVPVAKNSLLGGTPTATLKLDEGSEGSLGSWSLAFAEPAFSALEVEDVLVVAYFVSEAK